MSNSRYFVMQAGILLGTSLTAITLPAPACARDEFAVLQAVGEQVPDAELADIRGKFIKPESISYFGISMITSWQDASGVTTAARLVFNVDFLNRGSDGNPTPTLMVGWVREGDPSLDVTQNHAGYTALAVSPAGGLGSTNGVAQANIIAGADNAVLNGMQIALVPSAELAGMETGGLTEINASMQQGFADGDQLQFRLGANELGLMLTGNDGSVKTLQSAGGDLGSLLQQTMISSDGNSVFNNTAVIIGTDFGAPAFDAVRATEALSAMQGHGF